MSLIKKLKLDWIWLKLSYSFRWAHHPTCEVYGNQRFDLNIFGKRVSLCQGCTMVTIGSIFSFIAVMLTLILSQLADIVYIALLLIPVLPVIIIDGFHLSRFWKRIARLCLGISAGTAFAVILFYPSWWIKILVVLGLVSAKYAYEYFRTLSPSKDLCLTCQYLEDAPYCPGMTDKMEANKRYQELALPVMNSSIKSQVERASGQAAHNPSSSTEPRAESFEVVWVDDEKAI